MLGISGVDLRQLFTIFEQRDAIDLASRLDECALIAQRALALGEPLLSYDFCTFGLGKAADHLRLQQVQCLALARSGAYEQAQQLLERLYSHGHRDEETLGILARTYKDIWLEKRPVTPEHPSLKRSQELYEESYLANGGHWPGINAATLAMYLGQVEKSKQLAAKVRDECLVARTASSGEDHWLAATIGEASLLSGDLEVARSSFQEALAQAELGDRASMRRNARLALEAQGLALKVLGSLFAPVTVAVFTGHRIDGEEQAPPRFPAWREKDVAGAIRAYIENSDAQVGFASAASGGDILFHEAMLGSGRETHVVLPAPPDEFEARSLAADSAEWSARFRSVLKSAQSVIVHSGSVSGDIGYAFNNWVLLGLARSRARQIEGNILAFAIWDGRPGLPGGTSDAVRDWQRFGQPVEWIAPLQAGRSNWNAVQIETTGSNSGRTIGSQRVVSMLFADAVGFSKLSDDQIPLFAEHFLGMVANIIEGQKELPLTRNTWGDGLYLCFATPAGAGRFALDLAEAVRETEWTKFGLPLTLSLRIALHCGPVHEVTDPVLKQREFKGAHVSRAARIEPITPSGSVYCSQPFAALCECENVSEFVCDYVGRIPLAKQFGEFPMFAVRRRQAAKLPI